MALAIMAGVLLGFALGYGLKERKHADEMASVMRIVKRISEANREAAKKERAPKGPAYGTYFNPVNFGAIGLEAGKDPKYYD